MNNTRFRYEIDESLTLRVWDLENPNELSAPFLLQPYNPTNGEAWKDKEDVTSWAESYLDDLYDGLIKAEQEAAAAEESTDSKPQPDVIEHTEA